MSAGLAVELDRDLELLGDCHRHARCTICFGSGALLGVPFVALCGRRAINLRSWDYPDQIPPDACPECVAQWSAPCLNEANHPKEN